VVVIRDTTSICISIDFPGAFRIAITINNICIFLCSRHRNYVPSVTSQIDIAGIYILYINIITRRAGQALGNVSTSESRLLHRLHTFVIRCTGKHYIRVFIVQYKVFPDQILFVSINSMIFPCRFFQLHAGIKRVPSTGDMARAQELCRYIILSTSVSAIV